jgi:hypothetical protein
MAVKQNKILNQFTDFLPWVEKLRETDKDLWIKPISIGKWSLREILTHIMHWDKTMYSSTIVQLLSITCLIRASL